GCGSARPEAAPKRGPGEPAWRCRRSPRPGGGGGGARVETSWPHPREGAQRPRHRRVTVSLQAQGERAARAGLAADVDLAAEQERVLVRDRETQPGAAAGPRGIGLVEPLEQVR